MSRGILSGGFCPGGFCPGGFCPRTVGNTSHFQMIQSTLQQEPAFTGNLITMLRSLKNTTFSTAFQRTSDIMKNVKRIFETSDT